MPTTCLFLWVRFQMILIIPSFSLFFSRQDILVISWGPGLLKIYESWNNSTSMEYLWKSSKLSVHLEHFRSLHDLKQRLKILYLLTLPLYLKAISLTHYEHVIQYSEQFRWFSPRPDITYHTRGMQHISSCTYKSHLLEAENSPVTI